MASIIKPESTSFEDQLADVIAFLSKVGELDASDFFEDSIGNTVARAVTANYNQNQIKIDAVARESFMDSAIRDESIEYLAISQNDYNPTRKIAAQHTQDAVCIFRIPDTISTADLPNKVIGIIVIDNITYSLSILEELSSTPGGGFTEITARIGVGTWRTVTIDINEDEGDLTPFNLFTIDEDKFVIDDSGTTKVRVVGDSESLVVVRNISDVLNLSSAEISLAVLVTSNFFGGLDLNFGDGIIFGNRLVDQTASQFITEYFITAGFIENLAVNIVDIKIDPNFVTEIIQFDPLTNGISEESSDSIKTLAPAIALSQFKIITPDDMTANFSRLPNVVSSFAIKDTSVFAWESPRTYGVGDVVSFEDQTWVSIIEDNLDNIPLNNFTEGPWLLLNINRSSSNNATLILYALIDNNGTIETLTQGQWEIEFLPNFNFESKLGFLQVVVGDLITLSQNVTMTVILNQVTDSVNALSQSEISTQIRTIIQANWFILGKLFLLGDLIDSIKEIDEVKTLYIEDPISNVQLNPAEYYDDLGVINLTLTFTDEAGNRYGS